MNSLELYDIITLDNGNEYTILKILNKQQNKYYLLAPIDKNEEPDMDNIKIVEEIIQNGQIRIQEESDLEKLKELAKEFLSSIAND